MSPSSQPQPNANPSEELVAYLDGELAPDECRAVEERLANDAKYRQQLRDLDQAWEALEALPTSTVDDAFARTTIELACVAAQEDVSQRKSAVAAERRIRRQWWVAGAVAAGVVGFLMMRALAVHRNNLQLADLPVFQQADVLAQVDSIDFLRQLKKSVKIDELARDTAAFNTAVADFQQASAPKLAERRRWVDSLSAEKKSNLADNARMFENLPTAKQEKDRRRQLVLDLQNEPELQKTLIAYGQWLNRSPHNGPWREGLREELGKLHTPSEKVAAIEQRLHQEANRLQHLSTDDRNALRLAILKVAEERTDKLQWRKSLEGRRLGPDRDDLQFWSILRELRPMLGDQPQREAIVEGLVEALSLDAREHWRGLRNKEQRYAQFFQWIRDLRSTGNDEDLEQFFASEKVAPDERQRLLELPLDEMKDRLERIYMRSEIGFDWPELFEGGRGPGNGPPPGLGPGRFRQRVDRGPLPSDGVPPPGRRSGPGFRPNGPPGPDGPPPDDRIERRPADGRRRPPNDQPPPDPPPGPPPKPLVEEA